MRQSQPRGSVASMNNFLDKGMMNTSKAIYKNMTKTHLSLNLIGEKEYLAKYGSIFGVAITLAIWITILTTFFINLKFMLLEEYDTFQTTSTSVASKIDVYTNISIYEFDFMPFIDVRNLNTIDGEIYKIFTEIDSVDEMLIIDPVKLSSYVQIRLEEYVIHDNAKTIYLSDFRSCTDQDFYDVGTIQDSYYYTEALFCPDMKVMQNVLKLDNTYGNKNFRSNFAVKFALCDIALDSSCEAIDQIQGLLSLLFFTISYVGEKIDFDSPDDPIKRTIHFHSQFQLHSTSYHDNNNFIRMNEVKFRKSRWSLQRKVKELSFIDMTQKQAWKGVFYYQDNYEIRMTDDNIESYINEDPVLTNTYLIGGLYFYLAEDIQVHNLILYDVISLMAETGGFANILMGIHIFLGLWINYYLIMGNLIQRTYYKKEDHRAEGVTDSRHESNQQKTQFEEEQLSPLPKSKQPIKRFRFNMAEQISTWWALKYTVFWWFKKWRPTGQSQFDHLNKKISDEMDIAHLVKRVQGLSAYVGAVADHNPKLKAEARKKYESHVYLSNEDMAIERRFYKKRGGFSGSQLYGFLDTIGDDEGYEGVQNIESDPNRGSNFSSINQVMPTDEKGLQDAKQV